MLEHLKIKYNYFMISVGIVGGLIVSLNTLVQVDMKSLVAYSSVVHMNVLMCSMLTLMKMGVTSGYILMISHGLCSSWLFFMVNLYYERSGSRLMFFNKGMMNILPSLSVWWFFLCAGNFSFPFSLNFISEIFMIVTSVSWEIFLMLYLMLICFFSSAYSLYLYSYIQLFWGKIVFYLFKSLHYFINSYLTFNFINFKFKVNVLIMIVFKSSI